MRAAVLLALAACGDNGLPDPNLAQSGSRLHLVQYDYGDGAREIDTTWFHDAARGERCTPALWSDGVTRCTPAFAETVFTTADCTDALGRAPVGTTPPPYAMHTYWLVDHYLPSRLFETGAPVAAPAQAWELRGTACLPLEVTGYTYTSLGAEVPQDDLVRITHPEVPGTSRVQLRVVASADGLYAPIGLRDGERPCTPVDEPGATTTACLPDELASAEYFHDAACAEPVLAVATGEDIPAVVRTRDETTGCTSYHDVAGEVAAPPLFHQNGPSCVSIAAPLDNRYFLTGPRADVPELDRQRDPLARRIHPIALVAGDLRFPDVHLWDESLGTECHRSELAGALRCVPRTTIVAIERFDSDTCTTVVPLAEVRTGTCGDHAAFALGPTGTFRRIGGVHAQPVFHLSTGDRCLPYAVAEGIELRDVGATLPPDAFAAATVDTD